MNLVRMDGDELKAARKRAGLTQQQVAHEANCSIAFLQLLERGYQPSQSDARPRVERTLRRHA